MDAGKLRHRVTIQEKPTVTRDSFGGEVPGWGTVATVWAAVEPLAGREFLEGRSLEATVDTRIRIRYRSGLVPSMRVVWGSHTYDVQAVLEIKSAHREIHLMCMEVVE